MSVEKAPQIEVNSNGFKPLPYSIEQVNPFISSVDDLHSIVNRSHTYDEGTCRWTWVRRLGVPQNPGYLTGCEGYYVGGLTHVDITGYKDDNSVQRSGIQEKTKITHPEFTLRTDPLTSNDIKGLLTDEGKRMKSTIRTEERMKYWNTLTGEKVNLGALIDLYIQFGAVLSRLRAIGSVNQSNRYFKRQLLLLPTKPIVYEEAYGLPVKQKVEFYPSLQTPPELSIPADYPDRLDPSNPYGWMLCIGKLGHPLVRSAIDSIPEDLKNTLRYRVT